MRRHRADAGGEAGTWSPGTAAAVAAGEVTEVDRLLTRHRGAGRRVQRHLHLLHHALVLVVEDVAVQHVAADVAAVARTHPDHPVVELLGGLGVPRVVWP